MLTERDLPLHIRLGVSERQVMAAGSILNAMNVVGREFTRADVLAALLAVFAVEIIEEGWSDDEAVGLVREALAVTHDAASERRH